MSSGKSYARAGHQGNENGSYYVTEQREALDVIENSIPFNTRFIRPLSDGRGQGLPLLKLSANEKNVTSKLRYIRGTRELYPRGSNVLRCILQCISNAFSRTYTAFVTDHRDDLRENIQLRNLARPREANYRESSYYLFGCEFFRESQENRQIDSNPGSLAQFNGSPDGELTSEK